MRALPVLAVALAGLAGCDIPLPGQGTRSLPLLDGSLRVKGPQGYCVDPDASRPETGFAVLGACGLMVAAGIMPQTDGFITIQIGDGGTAAVAGNEAALASLLRTSDGVALLTEAGDPSAVTLGQIDLGDGIVSVRFTDSSPPPVEGLMADEWRAFLDIEDRLVTIGVRGYNRAPLTAGQAQALLYGTVAALRAAN
jgi:hypothetical protein